MPTGTLAGSTSQSQNVSVTPSETAPAAVSTQTTSFDSASLPSASTSQQIPTSTISNATNFEGSPSSLMQSTSASMDALQQTFTMTSEMEQAILRNLHALSLLQPTQLADLLQSNPQLQAVLAAMDQAKSAVS